MVVVRSSYSNVCWFWIFHANILIGVFSFIGILEWNPVPFPIPSRTRIPSRYRFLRDTGWGLGPTLEMTPLEVASTLHRGPGWWARSKTRPKTKKIRAPHRADSVYYPITCVLVLFCKWQFLGGHQCPSKGSGGDRWDRKWKILKKIDRCIESILLISNNPCFGSILGGTIFRRPQVPFGGVLGW